jgi:hypothetical protein
MKEVLKNKQRNPLETKPLPLRALAFAALQKSIAKFTKYRKERNICSE